MLAIVIFIVIGVIIGFMVRFVLLKESKFCLISLRLLVVVVAVGTALLVAMSQHEVIMMDASHVFVLVLSIVVTCIWDRLDSKVV